MTFILIGCQLLINSIELYSYLVMKKLNKEFSLGNSKVRCESGNSRPVKSNPVFAFSFPPAFV